MEEREEEEGNDELEECRLEPMRKGSVVANIACSTDDVRGEGDQIDPWLLVRVRGGNHRWIQ